MESGSRIHQQPSLLLALLRILFRQGVCVREGIVELGGHVPFELLAQQFERTVELGLWIKACVVLWAK